MASNKRQKPKKSRNALVGNIHEIRRGLAIYRVGASPYFKARMWSASQRRYLVRSTKETVKAAAISAAEAMFEDLRSKKVIGAVPKSHTFETFAEKLITRQRDKALSGKIHPQHAKNDEYILRLKDFGLITYFGGHDVTTLKPNEIETYLSWLIGQRGRNLAASTQNKYVNVYHKVLKLAVGEGVLFSLPPRGSVPREDNPRPFFRFFPLVRAEADEVEKLRTCAWELADEEVRVRGTIVTTELLNFIDFMLGSFLRPTIGEVFSLRHRHVSQASDDPPRLILRVPKGKTGSRDVITLRRSVDAYESICERYPDRSPDDFLFLPNYQNRETANRKMQDQFNLLLTRSGLKVDPDTGLAHSLYSLRHTAIDMPIIKSEGQVNVFMLARNAGTSVDQIERFYAGRLPISREMARNLQLDIFKVEREKIRFAPYIQHLESQFREEVERTLRTGVVLDLSDK